MTSRFRNFFHALTVFAASLSAASAANTLLEVQFSNYELGPVNAQTHGVLGASGWVVSATGEGKVIEPPNTFAGGQVLEFARNPGGGVHAPLAEALMMASQDKIAVMFDVLRPTAKSLGLIYLANEGATKSQSVGVYIMDTGRVSVNIGSTEMETERLLLSSADVLLEEGIWYRFEFEISQSSTAGEGTFDLYLSSEDEPQRVRVLKDQPYRFFPSKNTRLYLSPQNNDGLQVNHLAIYTGLETFPVSRIPDFPPALAPVAKP